MKKRAAIIVLDSVGIGSLPDAIEFGDAGAHTLGHVYACRGMKIPHMLQMGLGNIKGSMLPRVMLPSAAYGRSLEVTKAKDTTSGHWEMAGFPMEVPFRTYPNGFPQEIIGEFERRTGRRVIGNEVASGTEIIQRLGDEHVRTGALIVYTSADSVFQIAAHEGVVPLEELYRYCAIAREMLVGDNLVGRVIARPFVGKDGVYTRTENRRDYALEPMGKTILDGLCERGMDVVGIGKIEDIFAHRGITTVDHTKNNPDGIEATIRFLKEGRGDFIFTNLVDTDMLYGHRNDAEGYAKALEYFDAKLPEIRRSMTRGDLLIITADHGCDPCFPGTDHTREYIPVLAAIGHGKPADLGTRSSFADIGATVYEYLTGEKWTCGESFLDKLV
ncbi:MAG: phosphopentomutase [Clostridia bacterium]|nr:phosphopentomutase [Clostridia bacterium]MBQ4340898.1 phosphopentomutase [Clostridia bacterium]